jgi:hypothetical protein
VGQNYDADADIIKNEMLFHSIQDEQINPGLMWGQHFRVFLVIRSNSII